MKPTWRVRQEDQELKASLGSCFKNHKTNKKPSKE